MAFNLNKAQHRKTEFRTADVPIDDIYKAMPEAFTLKEGEKPVWTVRMLTHDEIAHCKEAAANAKNWPEIIKKLNGNNDKTGAVLSLMGLGDAAPAETAQQVEQLIIASVNPKCDRAQAHWLGKNFPIVFFQLNQKIMELTGLGAQVGKPKASTKKPALKTP